MIYEDKGSEVDILGCGLVYMDIWIMRDGSDWIG